METINGKQESNLTKQQLRGVKSLRQRRDKGEVVITPSDKTGRLVACDRKTYMGSKFVAPVGIYAWKYFFK